jgi:glycosyltransferase involved in cell wall biosynthesis
MRHDTRFGVVAIGRNEGKRLQRCLNSVPRDLCIYVDSGSTDGSVKWAREYGAAVVELNMSAPFTAARARNAGFKHLRSIAPGISYVQFVDGDCQIDQQWLEFAAAFLDSHADVGAVCGRRRERCPQCSIYNWLCDRDWDRPVGETRSFGGDVMLRVKAFEAVGGFRDELIAGEEPELCVRLREAGWRIWRVSNEMTLHDAAMTSFSQWWRRALRAGYAYALNAHIHGKSYDRHYVWETRRAWLWGVCLPLFCILCVLLFGWLGLASVMIYPLQFIRQSIRNRGTLKDRVSLALFELLSRFAETFGQVKFARDRLLKRQSALIEYK